jgi:hypothetical protein
MDGSKLSAFVVTDCCAEEPMGIERVQHSFDHLALKDGHDGDYEIKKSACHARGNLAIDPILTRIGKHASTDSVLTQSITTRSIDSGLGDSITSSLNSVRSVSSIIDTLSVKQSHSPLQSVPEKQTEELDEGIIEDDVQPIEYCRWEEAVPTTCTDFSGTLQTNQDGDT